MSMSDMPDFEITDLPRGPSPGRPHVPNPRAVRLRRLAGSVLAVLGVLLTLAIFLSSPDAEATLVRTLNLPVPPDQLPLTPGADVVYLERGAPWATLQIDGVLWTLERVDEPYTGREGSYTAIRLARGQHRLVYNASPFPGLSCTISVPAAPSDTCPLITHPGPQDVMPVLQGSRVMNLDATPERLKGSARTAFEAAISNTLAGWTPSATVAAGEPLLGAQGLITAATTPMKASLNYTLAAAPTRSSSAATGDSCPSICRLDSEAYLDDAAAFLPIEVRIRAHWTYVDAEGNTIDAAATATPGIPQDGVIVLFARWNGAWQVTVPYFGLRNLTCDIALAALTTDLKLAPSSQQLQSTGGLNAAVGCLVIERETAGRTTTTRYFLYRFGALLAVNDEARAALPDLPLVGVEARRVALQLGARLR